MTSEKRIKTQLKMLIYGSIALLFCGLCLNALSSNQVNVIEEQHSDIPCQNLDVLDSVEEILHWEIINDTLHIYTKEDEKRDEYERWKYIQSLEKEDY